MEWVINKVLETNVALMALINPGANAQPPLWVDSAPEDTGLPRIVIDLPDSETPQTARGSLDKQRGQVDVQIHAAQADTAFAIARLARAALDREPERNNVTEAGLTIEYCRVVAESSGYDEDADFFYRVITCDVWVRG